MDTFDDLGIKPEITEALVSEGIETPTPLQSAAIPVIRKGNNLFLEAGPGSGLLVAWATGLLDRVEAEGDQPRIVVLCASVETADRLAEAMARIAATSEHRIAALGAPWVLPARAHVLFATPAGLLAARAAGTVAFDSVEAVVVDQAQLMDAAGSLGDVESVFDYLPDGTQRILSALPAPEAVRDLVDRAFKRTVKLPAPIADAPPKRGSVRFRIAPEPREAAALQVIQDLFEEGARHALVYCRTEDRAADVGDYLTLHGFTAGAPGDADVPVWLGVDALESRDAARDGDNVVVVSCDCPTDVDALDRRHSVGLPGVVVLLPREVAHLKSLGKRAGYDTVPFPPKPKGRDAVADLLRTVVTAIEEEDVSPYLVALDPVLSEHDPAIVAAAALALLRKKQEAAGTGVPAAAPRSAQPGDAPSWSKLFVSVGDRDGLLKGDLLGAITGETGVTGDAVGRIEIRESHSLVEVHDTVARTVIQAINGTTIKGRSVRADFDRPRRSSPPRRKAR